MTRPTANVERSGFALLDVVFATLVFTVGGLAAAGLMIHSGRLAASASELRRVSGRLEEVADSLMWTSKSGPGRRDFVGGRVTWRQAGGLIHLEGWGADTTGSPLADLWTAKW